MSRRLCFTCLGSFFSAALLLAGCGPSSSDAAKPPGTAAPRPPLPAAPGHGILAPLPHAQPTLPKVKLKIGPLTLDSEVASEPLQIMTGMMHREKMEDTEGMIFILPNAPRRASFWMRNTKVSLSCAYVDCGGRILEIHDLRPFDETPVESGTEQICFVLEVPQGWFIRKKISVGEFISTDRGTLAEVFRKP